MIRAVGTEHAVEGVHGFALGAAEDVTIRYAAERCNLGYNLEPHLSLGRR
jgi:hypothetical protein